MGSCKKLYLLRHGSALFSKKRDFDRQLSLQGREEISRLKVYLEEHLDIRPELVLCAKDLRCRQTLKALNCFLTNSQIVLHNLLYLSSAYMILELLRFLDDDENKVLLIGHEKAIIGLWRFLIQDSHKRAIALPNGCLCGTFIGLSFEDMAHWSQMPFFQPRIENVFYP